jgi:hypothetical protein
MQPLKIYVNGHLFVTIKDEVLLKELNNKTSKEYEEWLRKSYNKHPDQEGLIKVNIRAFLMWKEVIPYG